MTRQLRARASVPLVLFVAFAVLAVSGCDWSQFRSVSGHTGASPDTSIKTAGVRGLVARWTATTGDAIESSPAIAGGLAYVGSDDHSLYAYNAGTGALAWSVATGGAVSSSPAVDSGIVFVGSDDHKLYAFKTSDHSLAWSATLDNGYGGVASAPVVSNGVVYAASAQSVYAFKADGTPLWSVPVTNLGPLSAPAVVGSTVYVAAYTQAKVWALRTDTGATTWSTADPGPRGSCQSASSSPAVMGNTVFVGLCPSAGQPTASLFAFAADTGAERWAGGNGVVTTSPSTGNGAVFAGTATTLEAVDPATGAVLWTGTVATGGSSSPAVVNGSVYLGSADHHLYAFDATGTSQCSGTPKTCAPLLSVATGGAVRSSPAVVNGSVFVGSDDHLLYSWGLPAIGFTPSTLTGTTTRAPTVARWGPDNRLYVAGQHGDITAYTIARNGPNNYAVTASEPLNMVKSIVNHNDDGTVDTVDKQRLVTGLLIVGTAANPVVYATSSDPRVGGGDDATVTNLDTNSGIISRLNRGSNGKWTRTDLVRGLPRSEENHATNELVLDKNTNTLFVSQGGNTNMGAPSNNFDQLPEYAYSAAVLSVNLNAIGNTTYDLPTLSDDNLPNLTGPFGGDDGRRQAKQVAGGPVQVYSPGYRNPFSLVLSRAGKLYTVDNGPNSGWGDIPIGAGPGGTCTNASHEPGTDDNDSLHYISAKGYYGGHANPTRGNMANTFNTVHPQSPVLAANPVECDARTSTTNGSIAQFNFPTTGMAEYTASNFADQMDGDLLVAGYYGGITRVHLSTDGKTVASTNVLFSSAGTHPIDVAVQDDNGAFPGTIWVPDNTTAGTITVFEPNDFGGAVAPVCTGADDPALDEDHDGFTNADEIDNHTDPCNAADAPHDWNHNFVSDLNDPDDDSDGIADVVDAFPVDPHNGLTTSIPLDYSWLSGSSNPCAPTVLPSGCPGGLIGLGFTGLMNDGVTDYNSLFDQSNMTVGGAAGVLTVSAVPPGDVLGATNTGRYGFDFGVNANPANVGVFTAHTRLLSPFAGITPTGDQSFGMFIGTGDQDNFVRLVATANGGSPGIGLVKEVGGVDTFAPVAPVALPGPDAIDLYLTVDPVAATVQATYRITTGTTAGPLIALGSAMSIPSSWLTSSTQGLAIGLASTSAGASPFPATWALLQADLGVPS